MNETPPFNVSPDQQFALQRFGRLLTRRLQVAVACAQLPASVGNQTWLVRALDGAISDDLHQLYQLSLGAEARDLLNDFRRALEQLRAQNHRAA